MRVFVQAAVYFSALALAFYIPPHTPGSGSDIAGSIAAEPLSVYFSVPCRGCFNDASEELDFELKLDSSKHECQSSNVIVNDVKLSPEAATTSSNSVNLRANTTIRPSTQQIAASWELFCLDDKISLLSLRIDEVFGQPRPVEASGFTISFAQAPTPHVLRLESAPQGHLSDVKTAHKWTEVQTDPEFVTVLPPALLNNDLPDELQHDLRHLHEIKARIGRLHHQYMRQERRIFEKIKHDFYACSGPSCLLRTAVRKAPDVLELVKAHFRHRPDWSKLHGSKDHVIDGRPGMHGQPSTSFPMLFDVPDEMPLPPTEFKPDHTPYPVPFDEPQREEAPLHPPPHHHDGLPPPPSPPHLPHHHDGPPPPPPPPPPHHHDGPPPPPPPPPPHHPAPPHHHDGPSSGPPPHHQPHGDHPHPGPSHGDGHLPGRPHHKSHHHPPHLPHHLGPHRHPFVFSASAILVFVMAASLLFKCVRMRTGLFHSRRRHRDHAARREESRNRAAYRRAALRYRWKQWWRSFTKPQSTADYEEKRSRVLSQEDSLESAMQSEITQLRCAHELVGDMMRAEENRQRLHHEVNFGAPSQAISSYASNSYPNENTFTTDSSSPLYQPPPSYDLELEGDMTVVDGFSYTPSTTDSTPDSSVVDCNPRMSMETRTTLMKDS